MAPCVNEISKETNQELVREITKFLRSGHDEVKQQITDKMMQASEELAVMNGFTSILLPKFDVKDALKTIHKQKPTLFPGAPTMYRAMLHEPSRENYDLSTIKACISGAAALPLDTQETFENVTGGKLVEGYGLTESAPVATANLIWGKRIHGSIGLPWPDTEVAIVKPEGEQAEVKEIGEVAIRGPQVMKGYWNRPEETEKTFLGDWLLTGDMN